MYTLSGKEEERMMSPDEARRGHEDACDERAEPVAYAPGERRRIYATIVHLHEQVDRLRRELAEWVASDREFRARVALVTVDGRRAPHALAYHMFDDDHWEEHRERLLEELDEDDRIHALMEAEGQAGP